MRGITKRFPGIVANDRVNFDLRRGEVHAILGENGAGKSTLMNVLYGLYQPDEGEIRVKGNPVTFSSAKDAIRSGIGMVHQHFMLIPVMTVAENIVLANEPTREGVFFDRDAAEQRVAQLSRSYKLAIDPQAKVQAIGVGQDQRVEILKALYRAADVLILDEPTAVLTPQEAGELFEILRTLVREGLSVIFISHKLNEVLERMMVGRDVLLRVEKTPAEETGDVLLEVDDLHVLDDRGLPAVKGVSLSVRAGEIVGIAGVEGNGQGELIEALTGLRKRVSGRVVIAGREVERPSARRMLDAGLGHIPEDRQRRGLILEFTIAENTQLHDYSRSPMARFGWIFPRRFIELARRLIEEFDVRGGGPTTKASALSGGNQQKVVVAREIFRDPKMLIAAQPTRGLDVGAIEYLHRRLVEERDEGRAILLVSLELDEILSLSDRILVIYEGELVGEHGEQASEEEIGMEMLGAKREDAA